MDPSDSTLEHIGRRLREALAVEGTPAEDVRRAREGFVQEIATRNARGAMLSTAKRTRLRLRWALLAGTLATGVAGFWLWPRAPISFRVSGDSAGRFGDLVEASLPAPTPLRFSEGSMLQLHHGGRLRVLSADPRGARVLVENGVLDASIAHPTGKKVNWSFEAGPFHVAITGTRFSLDFDPRGQTLRLATLEGQVMVSAPCFAHAKAVSAGETIDASCRSGSTVSTSPEPSKHPATSVASIEPEPMPIPVPASPRAAHGAPSWRELLAAGRLAEGLRAAERSNFEQVCQNATRRELLALADGGRLFGRPTRALTALRVLRERFPGSPDAATAAFMLGRVTFERLRSYNEAVRWFETYLREQPTGPLMGDAFGRLMEARLLAGDESGARTGAQQYLRRFPEGPYASEARGILSK
jgi:transmembrane sensor